MCLAPNTLHNMGLVWDLKTKRRDSDTYDKINNIINKKGEEGRNY